MKLKVDNRLVNERKLNMKAPEPASSSCGQKHEGNQQQHPKACCGPKTAGYLYTDPERERERDGDRERWREREK